MLPSKVGSDLGRNTARLSAFDGPERTGVDGLWVCPRNRVGHGNLPAERRGKSIVNNKKRLFFKSRLVNCISNLSKVYDFKDRVCGSFRVDNFDGFIKRSKKSLFVF